MKKFIQVEYDENYAGGNCTSVGKTILLPIEEIETLIYEKDMDDSDAVGEVFFNKTGLSQFHIIFWTFDSLYDELGNFIEE